MAIFYSKNCEVYTREHDLILSYSLLV